MIRLSLSQRKRIKVRGYDAALALSLAAEFWHRGVRCFRCDFPPHGKAIARQNQKSGSAFHHCDLHSGAGVRDRVDDRAQTVYAVFADRLARAMLRRHDYSSDRSRISEFRDRRRAHAWQTMEPASAGLRTS